MPVLEVFGPPSQWPDEDLVAFSDQFDADLVLAAYRSGVFPMPLPQAYFPARMAWWSPLKRGLIEPANFRASRSLRQSAKHYRVTVNQAFDAVLDGCADPSRPGGWIDADIRSVYDELHRSGLVVSVETWTLGGDLAGGLYGVSLGGLFAGESMFHDPDLGRDASKVALWRLITEWLQPLGSAGVIDVQWATPHLTSLGATTVSRAEYLARLAAVIDQPRPAWPEPAPRGESLLGPRLRSSDQPLTAW
ncbi:MAG: leucyl/phenylalanyl-tRNA--protein transferase [Propionibacteriaceae bacterium]|nr:leucyl/phenylalanyl-tRNA--protein transferase [Propionibacteriaceae bacterium]